MSRKFRRLAVSAAAVAGLVLLILTVGFYTLQTTWFKAQVRERVIAEIEKASGGDVELGSFNYNWRTLTAEFRNLVVHGTEPAGAEPLFRAESIRVSLKIISAFKRDVDIASLVVKRPEIHLIVGPDGTTNIPSPKLGRRAVGETVQALLNLKMRHFEFDDGIFQADARRIPIGARGENVFLRLAYDRTAPRYDVSISSRHVRIDSERWPQIDVDLDANAQVQRDEVFFQRLSLQSGDSKLQASGSLRHFAHPAVDLHVTSQLAAADIAKVSNFVSLRGGQFNLDGMAHYDESAPFSFSGVIAGQNVLCGWGALAFKSVNFHSDVLANPQQLTLPHLTLRALGGQLTGQAVLPNYRELQFDGSVSRFHLRDITALFSSRPLPWGGVANGRIHIRAPLDRQPPNFVIESKIQIAPAAGGIPVSGDMDVTYRRAGKILEFGSSHLNFPSSQLAFSGTLAGGLQVVFDSTNLDDLRPVLTFANARYGAVVLPTLVKNGSTHFDGTIVGPLENPKLAGSVDLARFRLRGETWDRLRSRIALGADALEFSSSAVDRGSLHAIGRGRIGLRKWVLSGNDALRIQAQFRGADVVNLLSAYSAIKLPGVRGIARGIASGSLDLAGSIADPHGRVQVNIDNLDAYGEDLNKTQVTAELKGDQLQVTRGRVQAGPASMVFSATYRHVHGSWRTGQLQLKLDTNGFPLASLELVRKYGPGLNAQFEIHGAAAARITPDRIEPENANGTAVFRRVTVNDVPYGNVTFSAATHGQTLETTFSGDLRESRLSGNASVQLVTGNPAKGELHLDRIGIGTLNAILNSGQSQRLPVAGFVRGGITFEGPLQRLEKMHGNINLEELQLSSTVPAQAADQARPTDLIFHNVHPIAIEASDGVARIRSFDLAGKDTSLTVSGSIPYIQRRPINLKVNGSLDLRFFQLLDANVQSSGNSVVEASVGGTLLNPAISGTLELKNGSFFFNKVANGLSAVNGTVEFDRDRATIRKLTAQTGGGELSLDGFVSFAGPGPLLYRLQANAQNVRVRYASSISVTASSQIQLAGTSENSILSGTTTVSRVVFNPNTDVGNLLASAAAPVESASNEKDFLTGMQLDVRVESAPNLQFNTSLSRDVQAEIDLRLRGTPGHPILLGSIAANQGDIRLFGAKYTINRGEISFVNPVKIEPVLDLDLQTLARGVTVDVNVSGTFNKLNINYRSDPPLQPRDIIALLTVGRAPDIASNVPNMQVSNDVSALQSGANTVLGQAISPGSNRLQKLFGITNIKIDPLVQGITNTPQSRLTLEQQISRQITVTYVTNLSQTSEQIFRVEWAFSPQYSVVALRDDNGEFGIDIQYKKRFK